MIIRRSDERGHIDHGWLNTYHTFSFGEYFDAQFHHFSALRVINEDIIAPNTGFGEHPHRDMEIITYVLSGALAHKDSMGNGSRIEAGEFQYMSAGSGVTHSEANPSPTDPVHLLQIWITPKVKGTKPRYDQKKRSDLGLTSDFVLVASPDGRQGSIAIHQDASLYSCKLKPNQATPLPVSQTRKYWLHVVKGHLQVGTTSLMAGDAVGYDSAELSQAEGLSIDAEILLFDLPV